MNRRQALRRVGFAGLVGTLGDRLAPGEAQARAPAYPQPTPVAPAPGAASPARAFTLFTPAEAAFVDAAVARLIPADALGPGAREAGCTYFIDQQLAGAFGGAARWYMQGPFGEATPEQGYQLPLTPKELYRLGIAQVDAHCVAAHRAPFARLDQARQDAILSDLERGRLPLADAERPGSAPAPALPQQVFFAQLLANTIEGFFADPIYGGNRDKAGWRLVGFPGVAAAYVVAAEDYNTPYDVEPVSIEDIVRGQAAVDEHGHPAHQRRG